MKVLIADKFEQSGLDGLAEAGCTVIFEPDLAGDALAAAIKATSAQVLVVRSTQVTEPMLEAGALSLIVRAGAGGVAAGREDVRSRPRRGRMALARGTPWRLRAHRRRPWFLAFNS